MNCKIVGAGILRSDIKSSDAVLRLNANRWRGAVNRQTGIAGSLSKCQVIGGDIILAAVFYVNSKRYSRAGSGGNRRRRRNLGIPEIWYAIGSCAMSIS